MTRKLLAAALLLLPSAAQAWPSDWEPLTRGKSCMVDDQSDQTTSPGEDPLDIVGNNHNCAAFWYLVDGKL